MWNGWQSYKAIRQIRQYHLHLYLNKNTSIHKQYSQRYQNHTKCHLTVYEQLHFEIVLVIADPRYENKLDSTSNEIIMINWNILPLQQLVTWYVKHRKKNQNTTFRYNLWSLIIFTLIVNIWSLMHQFRWQRYFIWL